MSAKQHRLALREQQLKTIASLPILDALHQSAALLVALGKDKESFYAEHLDYLYAIEAINAPKLAQLTSDMFAKGELGSRAANDF